MNSAKSLHDAAPLDARMLQPFDLPGLCHGFMGRAGGASRGHYATFNLASWIGDDDDAVAENWRRWREARPRVRSVVTLRQVHGNSVLVVGPEDCGVRPAGDGMVTAARGVVLGVFSADCVPILMVDPERRVAAAIHAGWRGTLAGIASAGVDAMVAQGASAASIHAALGPAIGPCCFEVDRELATRFEREVAGAANHTHDGRPGKAYLDLRGIIADNLVQAGLSRESIETAGPCTRCASDRYFSRRAAGGKTTGLQMSFIGFVE